VTTLAMRVAPARLLLPPAILASLALVAAGLGVIAPLVPVAAVVGLAFLLAAPMRWSAVALLGLALLADNPAERPMEGKWSSPLLPAGKLLYDNLHKVVGVDALRFSALELLLALLLVIVVARKLLQDPIDDPLGLGALPNPLKHAFAVSFAAIVCLELYGVASGGDFKNSLWQIRQIFWLPLLGVLFGHAFKTAGARVAVLRTIMLVAWVRALVGIYYYYAIAKPSGVRPEYATTHSDSVLAVIALLLGVMALVERPSRNHLLLNLLLQPVVFMGLIVNDRRLAFVSIGAGLLTVLLMGPPHLWTWLKRSMVVLVPLGCLYLAVGWHSSASIFKPVQTLRSLADNEDASNQTRDIENYNLIQTLKRSPLVGSGFGHEYYEAVQANRVDQYFAQYKYIAHNSVLWLISVSGWLGFSLLWAVYPAAVLVALRVHRTAVTATDRVTAFGAVAGVLCFVIQAWGDMGLQSWMATLVLTSLLGATGALWTAQQHAEACA
jgi:hypothetical protein